MTDYNKANMELTDELKQQIDAWFENKSEEEVENILKSYGFKEEHQYTLDELKRRVDEMRDYLFKYTSNTNQLIEVRLQRACLGSKVYATIEIND